MLIGRKIEDKIINVKKQEVWGITSRNNEQQMALHLLMDNSIPLVSLAGAPGAGKTLLALAAALELVLNRKKYSKIIVYRPVDMVGGQDIGFLPGNKFEKIISYMGAILDSFEVLFSNDQSRLSGKKQKDWMSNFEMFVEKGIIELDSIGFTRGRSIHDSIILLDDCQNFSKENLKTILTRINASSRIFMMGDQDQIDVKDIDMETNAVSIASEVFKESKLVAHLRLKETQRSPLAAEAIKLL